MALSLRWAARTSTLLTTTSVTAPSSPPTRLLSLPMTAFCTTFDRRRSTTRSNVLSCARSRFPARRSSRRMPRYTATVRITFSSERDAGGEQVVGDGREHRCEVAMAGSLPRLDLTGVR